MRPLAYFNRDSKYALSMLSMLSMLSGAWMALRPVAIGAGKWSFHSAVPLEPETAVFV
jgi:hypothetical protein